MPTSLGVSIERQSRDGSQSNRDKLYKRFKKLNTQGGAAFSILQSRSQQKLISDMGGPAPLSNLGIKPRQSATKLVRQHQSVQQALAEQHVDLSGRSHALPKQVKKEQQSQRTANFPYQSPTNTSMQRKSSNGAGSARAAYDMSLKQVSRGRLPTTQMTTAQANNAEYLTHLNDQFKRAKPRGRNQAPTFTCASVNHDQTGSLQGSNGSIFLLHGSLGEGNTTLSSHPYPNLNASKDRHQEVSPNSLKHDVSTGTQKILTSLNSKSRSKKHNYITETQSHATQKQFNCQLSENSKGADRNSKGRNAQIQIQQLQAQGNRTGQNSRKQLDNVCFRHPNDRLTLQQQMSGTTAVPQNQFTISLHSAGELNPNDSHLFQLSKQATRNPRMQQQPSGLKINSSAGTNNEALSFTKFEHPNDEVDQPSSYFWLNEELEAAAQENRIRQAHYLQNLNVAGEMDRRDQSPPENMNPYKKYLYHQHHPQHNHQQLHQQHQHQQQQQLAQYEYQQQNLPRQLMSQESEHVIIQPLPTDHFVSIDPSDESQLCCHRQSLKQGSSEYNSGLTYQQKSMVPQKNASLSNRTQKPGHLQAQSVPFNTGRLSHQPESCNHVSARNSLRNSYQEPFHQNAFKFGLLSEEILPQHDKIIRSSQESMPPFKELLQQPKYGLKTFFQHQLIANRRSSERNCPLNQTSMQDMAVNSRRQSIDTIQSGLHERAQCSTRTNPYSNLLNSNYIVSTAPSANQDQMTMSKVNSCSQFVPGVTSTMLSSSIGLAHQYPQAAHGANHGSTAGGANRTQTLPATRRGNTTSNAVAPHTIEPFSGTEYATYCDEKLLSSYGLNPQQQHHAQHHLYKNALLQAASQNSLQQATTAALSSGYNQHLNQTELVLPSHSQEQESAEGVVHEAYSNQVAHQLLAQVKPGILKLIQSKVDAIVRELCDEGFCDQRTIMNVLEQRASKLFPENFMISGFDSSVSQVDGSGDPMASTQHQTSSALNQNNATGGLGGHNATIFTSHQNQSQIDDMALDRSIYSDMLITNEISKRQQQIAAMKQLTTPSNLLQKMRDESSQNFAAVVNSDILRTSVVSDNSSKRLQSDLILPPLNMFKTEQQAPMQVIKQASTPIDEIAVQLKRGGLNTTEKIIQAMQQSDQPNQNQRRDEGDERDHLTMESSRGGSDHDCNNLARHEVMQTHQYAHQEPQHINKSSSGGGAQDEQRLNTERLIDQIRDGSEQMMTAQRERHLESRRQQKSDEFKITFACTSKKASMEIEQQASGSRTNQISSAMAVYGLQRQQQQEQQIHLNKENLVSFDPSEFQVQSPQLQQDQILSNIRNFTNQKQMSSAKAIDRNASTPITPYAQEASRSVSEIKRCDDDIVPQRQQRQLSHQNEGEQEGSKSCMLLDALDEHSLGQEAPLTQQRGPASELDEQQRLRDEVAMLYMLSANHSVTERQNLMKSDQSRNKKPQLEAANTLEPSVKSMAVSSQLYQRTLGSEKDSEKRQRNHVTQNSDLIDQFGGEFVIDSYNSVRPSNQTVLLPIYVPTSEPSTVVASSTPQTQMECTSAALPSVENQTQKRMQNPTNPAQFSSNPAKQQQIFAQNQLAHAFNGFSEMTPVPQEPFSTTNFTTEYGSQTLNPQSQVTTSRDKKRVVQAAAIMQSVPVNGQQTTNSHSRQNSRHVSRSSLRSIEMMTRNLATGGIYDVRAEGSIINIKRNIDGDPEMLILSSQKELNDAFHQKSKMSSIQLGQQKQQSQKRAISKQHPKAASRKRSHERTQDHQKEYRKVKKEQKRPLVRPQRRPQSFSLSSRRRNSYFSAERCWARQNNMMTLFPSKFGKRKFSSPALPFKRFTSQLSKYRHMPQTKARAECEKIKAGIRSTSRLSIKHQASATHTRISLPKLAALQSLTQQNSPVNRSNLVEKEILKSVKNLRKENFEAKRDLKSIYDHKVSKMKQQLYDEHDKNIEEYKKQLKLSRHTTQLHKRRADRFKAEATELVGVAEEQKQRNERLVRQLYAQPIHRRSTQFQSRSRTPPLTRLAASHSRLPSSQQFEAREQGIIFGRLGVTHKPSFSHISKDLPRNNANFSRRQRQSSRVNAKNATNKISALGSSLYDNALLIPPCHSSVHHIPCSPHENSTSKLRLRIDLPDGQKDKKLVSQDLETVRNIGKALDTAHEQSLFQLVNSAHCPQQQQLQTFGGFSGPDQLRSFGSTQSYEELKRGQKSFFDAARTFVGSSKEQTGELQSTPGQHQRHLDENSGSCGRDRQARLMQQLQMSGAFFRCGNCKRADVKLELPCSTCESVNYKTDEKQKKHRRKKSAALSETSWDSSDLNSEYQRSSRRETGGRVYSSKLLQCSSELIANQERLDQIQKILFQPKQPRQGSSRRERSSRRQTAQEAQGYDEDHDHRESKQPRGRSTHSARERARYHDSSEPTVTLPQMIEKLRRSRQNLKF